MKKNKTYSALIAIFFGLILTTTACKKPVTPPNPNEEELITTLLMTFTDSAGVKPSTTVAFKDPDGDGGNNPTQWDTIKLAASTTYNMSLLLLDESKSPADTISNEVLAEASEHLFCFTISGANCQVKRTDSDGTYEIGLQSKWTTGAISNGNAEVMLRHQPGTKDGTCTPGATDISLSFLMQIQ
ncbi:MAG: hypothetical protein JNJ58_07740 [Chitinophagaceae bacterium]|nr:hypothetical protein [Chitinophagaceae bacterium]